MPVPSSASSTDVCTFERGLAMGGIRSGRKPSENQRLRTEDCPRLDLRSWKRGKYLYPGQEFGGADAPYGLGPHLRVQTYDRHLVVSDPSTRCCDEPRRTVIQIERSKCAFGGNRDWFMCPSEGCGKRVVVLYVVAGKIVCRACGKLTYRSQYESPYYRALNRAQTTRVILGGPPNLMLPFPTRPRGIRGSRYCTMRDRALKAESLCWDSLTKRLSRGG